MSPKAKVIEALKNQVSKDHYVTFDEKKCQNFFGAKTVSSNAAVRELINAKTHAMHLVKFPVELGNITLEAWALVIAPFGTTKEDILEHQSYVYPLQP